MARRFWVAMMLLPAACASNGQRYDPLEFYDWLKVRREDYNSAIAQQDVNGILSISRLIRRTSEPFVATMIDDVDHTDTDSRLLAIFGLGFVPSQRGREVLLGLLDDPNPLIRAGACASLGVREEASTPVGRVMKLAGDRNELVRQASLFALWHLLQPGQDRGALPVILARLDDPSDLVRSEALVVLRRLALPSTVQPLVMKGLKDKFAVARMNAATALGAMGVQAYDAVPALIETLRDPEHKVVLAAWYALRKITQQDLNEWSYSTWLDWFEQDEKLHVYVCSDHPKIMQDRPGDCPECSKPLDRILRDVDEQSETVVTGDYMCPNHADVCGTVDFICPKCGERLKPKEELEKEKEGGDSEKKEP